MSGSVELELNRAAEQYWQQWSGLRQPSVRALAWLLSSAPLLEHDWAPQQLARPEQLLPPLPELARYLHRLDQQPSALDSLLAASPGHRLGNLAEVLMQQFLLDHSDECRRGLALRDQAGRTIGEFDFLTRNGSHWQHWELAVKFYLHADQRCTVGAAADCGPALNDYIGSGLSDRLGDKTGRMLSHQLSLSSHPAYASLALPRPEQSLAWIRGYLFYPAGQTAAIDLPAAISAQHGKGLWLTCSELGRMPAFSGICLARQEWLAPARCDAGRLASGGALLAALQQHFGRSGNAVMLAKMQGSGQLAYEQQRWMIVPDDWPQRAAQWRVAMAGGGAALKNQLPG